MVNDVRPPALREIPLLSQWSLILLTLLLLTGTSITLMPFPRTVASRKVFKVNGLALVFDVALYKSIMLRGLPLMGIVFLLCSWWDGGFFLRNLAGTILVGVIIGFWIHIVILGHNQKD